MIRKNSKLFLLELFILSLFYAALCTCGKDEKGPSEPEIQPFIIYNLGVTFDAWNRDTNYAGDFFFTPEFQKIFLEFGARVLAYDWTIKELPTFEYVINRAASVFAIAEGEVTGIVFQENTQDYEFAVRSTRDPDFLVIYDHVSNVAVALGDHVEPGDTLGNPGTATETLGRFEIMINNTETGLSYCPLCYIEESIREAYIQKIAQFMLEWEEFKNDSTLYDEENYALPGCRYESMITY